MSDQGVRPSFARYRERMEAAGFRPSKRFGQNFLLDPSLHRAIADAARIDESTTVLEVGVGLGFLTRELARRAGRVVGVEIDSRLAGIVREELDDWEHGGRVELLEGDALGVGDALPEVIENALHAAQPPLAVVANLPYSVAGRFLASVLAHTSLPVSSIAVVVQRELAERLAAPPGSKDYGGLSVLAQARGPVELVRKIGREVFRPRPNVDSALVRVGCEEVLPEGFAPFVRTLFAARRKTLRYAMDRLDAPVSDAIRERFSSRRAEQCGAAELLTLYRTWRSSGTS